MRISYFAGPRHQPPTTHNQKLVNDEFLISIIKLFKLLCVIREFANSDTRSIEIFMRRRRGTTSDEDANQQVRAWHNEANKLKTNSSTATYKNFVAQGAMSDADVGSQQADDKK